MSGRKTVKIDAFPESVFRYLGHDAAVCIDVMRATTTALTAAAQGRRVLPVASVEEARELARRLEEPLLAGEMDGVRPDGFDMQNSPATLAKRTDTHRPLVLVSSTGTHLIVNSNGLGSGKRPEVYIACFRNMTATAEVLARRAERVALLGAGTRGEFRCEDEMAAAWIAERLIARDFDPEDDNTANLVKRWSGASVTLAAWGKSADYLRRSNQVADLEFVLAHIDDLHLACRYEGGEILPMKPNTDRAWRVRAASLPERTIVNL